jgi:hypothetical protein
MHHQKIINTCIKEIVPQTGKDKGNDFYNKLYSTHRMVGKEVDNKK